MHLKGRELKSLNSISITGLNDGEKVILSTLAGLAASVTGDQVYINEGGPSSVWLKQMQNKYGIPVNTYNALAPLVQHYVETGVIKGVYCLYALFGRTISFDQCSYFFMWVASRDCGTGISCR